MRRLARTWQHSSETSNEKYLGTSLHVAPLNLLWTLPQGADNAHSNIQLQGVDRDTYADINNHTNNHPHAGTNSNPMS